MRVGILAYDGCVVSGVSGFCDTLAVAGQMAGQDLFETRVLSLDGKSVRCFSGPDMAVDAATAPGKDAWDLLYLPPAFGLDVPPPDLVEQVGLARQAGAIVCAACFGVFFLAQAGLLDGRTATTHWALAEDFQARYPHVRLQPEQMLVDGGDYICAGGLTAYFDLALHIVARFASPELAAVCARTLLLDPGRARQTPYINLTGPPAHGDELVLKAQEWLEANHARPLRMTELARAVHAGERNLARRFKRALGRTPGKYLQALRVEHAKRQLESGDASIDEIIALVGYQDGPAFFRLFKEMTGLTPGEYRARFRVRPLSRL